MPPGTKRDADGRLVALSFRLTEAMPRRYAEARNRVFHKRQSGRDGNGMEILPGALDVGRHRMGTQNL